MPGSLFFVPIDTKIKIFEEFCVSLLHYGSGDVLYYRAAPLSFFVYKI